MYLHPNLSPDNRWLAVGLADGATTNLWALGTADGSWRQVTDFGDQPTIIAPEVLNAPPRAVSVCSRVQEHRGYRNDDGLPAAVGWGPGGDRYRCSRPASSGGECEMSAWSSADVSTPRELFTLPVSALASSGSQYDVGQDGKRFLIQVPIKKAPLEVIMNWQALLK